MTEQLGLFDNRLETAPSPHAGSLPLAVRESRRARRLTLRLLLPHTLELVVPQGTKPAHVAAFVERHRHWIERARSELASRGPEAADPLPTVVRLRAIERSWQVCYRHERAGPARCRSYGDRLEVVTRDAQHRDASQPLRSWLLAQAQRHLKPWLLREAQRLDRRPRAVQVRLQRTRWGSCSSTGTISLNAGLLFLEPALVRYLFVHELCHLISLDHSPRFWRAVERFEPDYRELDRALSAAWPSIPAWAYERRHGTHLV
jgi:predicted metal-dependent hydrolase